MMIVPTSVRLRIKKAQADWYVLNVKQLGTYINEVFTTQGSDNFTLLKQQIQELGKYINEMPFTLSEKRSVREAAQEIAIIPDLLNIEEIREKLISFLEVITQLSTRIGLEEAVTPAIDSAIAIIHVEKDDEMSAISAISPKEDERVTDISLALAISQDDLNIPFEEESSILQSLNEVSHSIAQGAQGEIPQQTVESDLGDTGEMGATEETEAAGVIEGTAGRTGGTGAAGATEETRATRAVADQTTVGGSLLFVSDGVPQTVASGAPIIFNEDSLQGISFNGTTTLTIAEEGFYYLDWQVSLANGQDAPNTFGIVVDGSTAAMNTNSTIAVVTGSSVINLAAGSTVELNNLSPASKDITAPSAGTRLSIFRIGS
ncbi:Gly-Xaa-Xaa repeat protein [Paenibacillus dakarensis]|uniref:Gly-Xaa-Xaa repeat protein n=1 Tax=Paenibacillus dakarensis TaxID=1527293 RepID=UPI0014780C20|nr:Gly-Xaa-Xaa repeat protein [Paenibacillus dakarensis]